MQSPPVRLGGWALVLGVSSGFGEAASIALARAGLDVFGVHLDRKSTIPNVERIVAAIEGLGRRARFFNVNAAMLVDQARRRNPSGHLTAPEDVARALVVLAHPDTAWITGNVIGVDGGEDIVG